MVTVSGNPNPTNFTYPTNPTTKYRCEFGTLFCIYAFFPVINGLLITQYTIGTLDVLKACDTCADMGQL